METHQNRAYRKMHVSLRRLLTNTDLLAVLCDDGLHGSHVGGLHHECDSLSLSNLHHSLEHHGIVVARRQRSYRHHLDKRGFTQRKIYYCKLCCLSLTSVKLSFLPFLLEAGNWGLNTLFSGDAIRNI